jgi:hypothetical protein
MQDLPSAWTVHLDRHPNTSPPHKWHPAPDAGAALVDIQVIVRHQAEVRCASITCMIRHHVGPEGQGDLRSLT